MVLTVVVLAVLLPVLTLELSHSDTSTSPPPIIYTTVSESPWTTSTPPTNVSDDSLVFPAIAVADMTTVLPVSEKNLSITVNSIYELPGGYIIFVNSFIKHAYDSITFTVFEKIRFSHGSLIVFTVKDCQELDVDRIAVDKSISLSVTRPIQHVDEGYYLDGSSLTYSITPSQGIVSSSCDCPVILVIYDDLEIYIEFLKTGIQTGFIVDFCFNRDELSTKIVVDKNSYLYAGLVICTTIVPTTINLRISGISHQYNIHAISEKSCVIFYDNNINRCTISLSTSITMAEDNDELCIVALVFPVNRTSVEGVSVEGVSISNGKRSTPNLFALVCAIFNFMVVAKILLYIL